MQMESVPSLRFYPSKKAFIKWTKIAGLCSVHNFLLGFIKTDGKFVPMLFGILTIIFVFAMIESNPRYEAIKEKNNLFKRAIDIGIKLRCGYAWVTSFAFCLIIISPEMLIFSIPDVYIGMAAICISYVLFNMDAFFSSVDEDWIHSKDMQSFFSSHSEFVNFFRVYATTIIDGLLHSIILAFLCGIIYFIMSCLRVRKENE